MAEVKCDNHVQCGAYFKLIKKEEISEIPLCQWVSDSGFRMKQQRSRNASGRCLGDISVCVSGAGLALAYMCWCPWPHLLLWTFYHNQICILSHAVVPSSFPGPLIQRAMATDVIAAGLEVFPTRLALFSLPLWGKEPFHHINMLWWNHILYLGRNYEMLLNCFCVWDICQWKLSSTPELLVLFQWCHPGTIAQWCHHGSFAQWCHPGTTGTIAQWCHPGTILSAFGFLLPAFGLLLPAFGLLLPAFGLLLWVVGCFHSALRCWLNLYFRDWFSGPPEGCSPSTMFCRYHKVVPW